MRRAMRASTEVTTFTEKSDNLAAPGVTEAPRERHAPANETVNILIVDDLPANVLALEAVLDGPGQNLVKAHSGPEALKRVLHDDFAVILLDVFMPGMDGFETAALIRERDQSRHTPIIFLTALGHDHVQ